LIAAACPSLILLGRPSQTSCFVFDFTEAYHRYTQIKIHKTL
jgi:hypothetical protein